MRKRSSCDSGSGNVPAWCSGFWVAITKKGAGSGVRVPVERDLVFLHGLEQRALGLWRGAVDLVGEHHVGKDRARMETEGGGGLLEDRHADDVGGQHVAGELDAAEGQAQHAGQ